MEGNSKGEGMEMAFGLSNISVCLTTQAHLSRAVIVNCCYTLELAKQALKTWKPSYIPDQFHPVIWVGHRYQYFLKPLRSAQCSVKVENY